MSTDGALAVCHRILNGEKLEEIPFCDFPLEFVKNERESVELPFKYIMNEDGKPNLPTGLLPLVLADFSLVGNGEEGDGLDWFIDPNDVIDIDYQMTAPVDSDSAYPHSSS
jgi:hypothetical protein